MMPSGRSEVSEQDRRDYNEPTSFVEALLRQFAPLEVVERFDFTTLWQEATESVAPDGRKRLADLCWRLRLADIDVWVLLIFEFQAKPDRAIPVRLLHGIAGRWEAAIRAGAADLPAVLPIVLYNGQQRWTVPSDIEALLPTHLPEALRRFQPRFEYLLIDELRLSFAELLQADNLHARVPAEKRLAIAQAFGQFARYALHDHIAPPLLETLLDSQALSGDQTMFALTMQKALKHEFHQGLNQGLHEGLHQGRQEGEAALLERQLIRRFGALPEWAGERLRSATEEDLIRWAEAVLSAPSLEAVFDGQ